MIPIPSGMRVCLAVGHTDMQRGVNSLAMQVQQGVRGHHVTGERVDQRLQRRRGRTDPARQGRGLQFDILAGKELGLAIKR
jgi:hypothetical protein